MAEATPRACTPAEFIAHATAWTAGLARMLSVSFVCLWISSDIVRLQPHRPSSSLFDPQYSSDIDCILAMEALQEILYHGAKVR